MKVLVSDPIAQEGIAVLQREAEVDVRLGLSPEQLIEAVADYHALVVRSETKVTAAILAAGKRLQVVARAGVGVDNIDVEAATRQGIVVVNSPHGNTIAAAEHTLALLLALARHIPQGQTSLKAGEWKRARFVGVELKGKSLGIIGLGKVGAEVASRAAAFGMEIMAHDPYISPDRAAILGVRLLPLDALLASADFITIHTPLTADTKGMLGARELALLKPGVRILNVARGGMVDEAGLVAAIHAGQVAGAAIDVFSQEPPPADNPLFGCDQVIVTPHLGASTMEAQRNVAVDVAEQVVDIFHGRPPKYAVNMPVLLPEAEAILTPYLSVADRLGRFYTQVEGGPMEAIEITYAGEIAGHNTAPLRAAVLRGLLEPISTERINLINAEAIARSRGIDVTEHKAIPDETYGNVLTLKVADRSVAGAFLHGQVHIVTIDGLPVDLEPKGYLLVGRCVSRPGLLGRLGMIIGEAGIGILSAIFTPKGPNGEAIVVMGLESPAPEEAVARLREVAGMRMLRPASF